MFDSGTSSNFLHDSVNWVATVGEWKFKRSDYANRKPGWLKILHGKRLVATLCFVLFNISTMGKTASDLSARTVLPSCHSYLCIQAHNVFGSAQCVLRLTQTTLL